MKREIRETQDILFAPKPRIECVGFGEAKIDPTNPDRIIGTVVFDVYMPDPKQCVLLRNVAIPNEAQR